MLDNPDFESKAIARQRRRWEVLDDVWVGTEALRAKTTAYLPMGPAEEHETYTRRLYRSRFYNVFRRAVKGLGGILLETPPTLDDAADKVFHDDATNIDGQGTALEVFAREVAEQGVRRGWGLILVDAPTAPGPRLTQAEANALGLRPYWIHIPADAVRNLRTKVIGGVTIIDQLTYRETVEKAKGEFEVEEVSRWRVLRYNNGAPGWQVWESPTQKGQPALIEEGTWAGFDRIPLAVFYAGDRRGVLDCDPPLWDLTETNLDHYIVANEHRHCLHVASVPVAVFTGVPDGKDLTWAPDVGIVLPENATAQYLEHSGAALGQTRQELQDLESRMANQSLAMVFRETRAAETAEAKRIDKAAQDAQIAVMATGLKDALEQAFVWHARFRGIEAGDAPIVRVNTDFEDYLLEAGELAVYLDLVREERMSLETLWDMMLRAKRLPPDFDGMTEVERLQNPIMPRPDPVDIGNGDEDAEEDEAEPPMEQAA